MKKINITVRSATESDIERINKLLFDVAAIHAEGRPDIFKANAKKYTDCELLGLIKDSTTPIFVAVDDKDYVLGYAFCVFQITENSLLLQDRKTLYIDDICVDKDSRGMHIGKALYDYTVSFAENNGFDNITLNVWALNDGACKFYEKCGMIPLKTTMEKIL